MAESTPSVPFFKKSKRPTTTARKRSPTADNQESTTLVSEVVRPAPRTQTKLLSQGTKRTVSQRDDYTYDTSDGVDTKDGSAVGVNWQGAGAVKDHADAKQIFDGEEAEEMMEQKRKKARLERGEVDDVVSPDGLYRGQDSYQHKLGRKDETMLSKAQRIGPVKGSNTVRNVTMIDYQPDVCKDYKETGYCGFGDTCKFLHDRGTYLQGWQLDKVSSKSNFITFATRAGLEKRQDTDSDDSDIEDIPFACILCRNPYTDPIVTKCGHYFCQACAIKRYAKNPRCAACGAPTNGIFNKADKIIARSKAKRLKEAKAAGELEGSQSDEENAELEGVEIEGGY
ncbi:related to N.crassa uvs2 protein [Serendipita indica DSM 11827]|uniref:Pre-mRNA-splicing factor CWC24 n=1 Tax=Serendipita indica (strain DSM 11827) TaxID=1109443 RepID=G4TNE7_SERID|nr:related to N.crassa uvs2 protein [Serendipita indica DSM 11827]